MAGKAGRLGPPKEHIPCGSVTDKQQRLPAFPAKTLRAVDLLTWACVGSSVIAHCGDIPDSPPWPKPKSLTAGPLAIFRQALRPQNDPTHRVCSPSSHPPVTLKKRMAKRGGGLFHQRDILLQRRPLNSPTVVLEVHRRTASNRIKSLKALGSSGLKHTKSNF